MSIRVRIMIRFRGGVRKRFRIITRIRVSVSVRTLVRNRDPW